MGRQRHHGGRHPGLHRHGAHPGGQAGAADDRLHRGQVQHQGSLPHLHGGRPPGHGHRLRQEQRPQDLPHALGRHQRGRAPGQGPAQEGHGGHPAGVLRGHHQRLHCVGLCCLRKSPQRGWRAPSRHLARLPSCSQMPDRRGASQPASRRPGRPRAVVRKGPDPAACWREGQPVSGHACRAALSTISWSPQWGLSVEQYDTTTTLFLRV
mmetsp:Transcript_17040/g.45083  ORF Transcript_17040/g.45083 Transcript_17040/m.45083 type:complete len:209 (+) Transcript_17040:711-1337(+)